MAIVAAGRPLCRVRDLDDPGSKGVYLEPEGIELFVVRRAGALRAYRNHCPHTGAPLEWLPDRFLNADGTLIQCALHGAQFRIDDGFCIAGPCAGQALRAVAIRLEGDRVVLAEPLEGEPR